MGQVAPSYRCYYFVVAIFVGPSLFLVRGRAPAFKSKGEWVGADFVGVRGERFAPGEGVRAAVVIVCCYCSIVIARGDRDRRGSAGGGAPGVMGHGEGGNWPPCGFREGEGAHVVANPSSVTRGVLPTASPARAASSG